MENTRFIPVGGVPGGVVHAIAEDSAGNIWIANQSEGLIRLRDGNVVGQIPWTTLGHKDFATALGADPLHDGLWIRGAKCVPHPRHWIALAKLAGASNLNVSAE